VLKRIFGKVETSGKHITYLQAEKRLKKNRWAMENVDQALEARSVVRLSRSRPMEINGCGLSLPGQSIDRNPNPHSALPLPDVIPHPIQFDGAAALPLPSPRRQVPSGAVPSPPARPSSRPLLLPYAPSSTRSRATTPDRPPPPKTR
jgi:hypothetical protein